MSTYYQCAGLIIGKTASVLELHKQILTAEAEQPSHAFSAQFLSPGVDDVLIVLYRAGQPRSRPVLDAVLTSLFSVNSLDLCGYLATSVAGDVTTTCYHRGGLIALNTPVDTDADITLGYFQGKSYEYGVTEQHWSDFILPMLHPSHT